MVDKVGHISPLGRIQCVFILFDFTIVIGSEIEIEEIGPSFGVILSAASVCLLDSDYLTDIFHYIRALLDGFERSDAPTSAVVGLEYGQLVLQ